MLSQRGLRATEFNRGPEFGDASVGLMQLAWYSVRRTDAHALGGGHVLFAQMLTTCRIWRRDLNQFRSAFRLAV